MGAVSSLGVHFFKENSCLNTFALVIQLFSVQVRLGAVLIAFETCCSKILSWGKMTVEKPVPNVTEALQGMNRGRYSWGRGCCHSGIGTPHSLDHCSKRRHYLISEMNEAVSECMIYIICTDVMFCAFLKSSNWVRWSLLSKPRSEGVAWL